MHPQVVGENLLYCGGQAWRDPFLHAPVYWLSALIVRINCVLFKEGETVERVDTDAGQKALDQLEEARAEFARRIRGSQATRD